MSNRSSPLYKSALIAILVLSVFPAAVLPSASADQLFGGGCGGGFAERGESGFTGGFGGDGGIGFGGRGMEALP